MNFDIAFALAKVLSNEELTAVLDEIESHRYPDKNALSPTVRWLLSLSIVLRFTRHNLILSISDNIIE